MGRKYCPHLIVTCQNMLVYHLQGTYNTVVDIYNIDHLI